MLPLLQGVYMSEGIVDLVAGVITSIVIFTTFPKVFAKREAEVKAQKRLADSQEQQK
uniref:hypothetical protein n=1 Tax=Candidatus Fimenecus sp. TaxID=3022888 RepID=UPI004027A821